MIPVSLSLRNFLSYGEGCPPLDFTQFSVACLSGANGHGKSALLDALTYALWGEARKSAGERKPDEGLLRLGTSEMQVELCFELDDSLFRVIRSFRKKSRSGTTQLELQVFDEVSDQYRSLSESSSLTRTQERINQLLSMDYDTFINSAFIVQGRADEFTQKGARERKQILGEILGLSRYDQLQAMARTRLLDQTQRFEQEQRRLGELDEALAHKDQYTVQLQTLSAQLDERTRQLEGDEKVLEELRDQRHRREHLERQLAENKRQSDHLQERRQRLEKEQNHLQSQQEKDSEIIAQAATIQRDFTAYQELTGRESQLSRTVQEARNLETRSSQLDAQILQARHEVEQRLHKWEAQKQAIGDQLQSSRDLLNKSEIIKACFQLFEATRQQEQALEIQRIRHEALKHERAQMEHQIGLAEQRLQAQKDALENQIETLNRRLQERDSVEKRRAEIEQEIASLQNQLAERDQLKDAGSHLRAQLQQKGQQILHLEAEREKAREKVHILRQSTDAQCPLCGSRLDEEHQRQLDDELARQEQDQAQQIEREHQSIQDLEKELGSLRQRYQDLDKLDQPLQKLQRGLADQQAQQNQFAQTQTELTQLQEQGTALTHTLDQKQYEQENQTRLAQIETELQDLHYQENQHQEMRESLRQLTSAEAEHTHLQEAQVQAEKISATLAEAVEKYDLAHKYLEEDLYAQEERKELEQVRQQLNELGYDATEHQQIREQIDELSAAVALRERLIAAQQRHDATQETIAANATELVQTQETLEKLGTTLVQTEEELKTLTKVEEQFTSLTERLAQLRVERDQLLQQQGSLQVRYDQCLEMSEERDKLHEQMRASEREIWIYQQLSEAFGKDGIQALIIENAVPEIEEEANAILARLTDNRIQIAIESLRDLKKGGTRETLDIKIADEIGERSYHLYSGGEAFRTNFALRIALSKVLARRAGTRLRTLIIDEGFGTQDSQGLEQLIEAIQVISRDFDKVLVVTHMAELKNAFPVQIEVTKYPDVGSRFEIIKNA